MLFRSGLQERAARSLRAAVTADLHPPAARYLLSQERRGLGPPVRPAVGQLQTALDSHPGARLRPLPLRIELRRYEKARAHLGRRVDHGILEYLRLDERPRAQVVVAVADVVGDVRDDVRIEDEVDELVCRQAMRRASRDQQRVVGDVRAFTRYREPQMQMQARGA